MNVDRVNGRELASMRVHAGLRQREVAARIGVTKQRVGTVELSIRVSPTFAARYLAALDADHVSPAAKLDAALDEFLAEVGR